jgi:hypothetical protein
MASTDPISSDDIIASVLQNIVAEKTGQTPSQENYDEYILKYICQPLDILCGSFTPKDWLKIIFSHNNVSVFDTFFNIFFEHLSEYKNLQNSACNKCVWYLMEQLHRTIRNSFVCFLLANTCGTTPMCNYPIGNCNCGGEDIRQCDKIVENSVFISTFLDIIPNIYVKFYEYLFRITTTDTIIKDTLLNQYNFLFNEYGDYFCQQRDGKFRCCSEAVSEGGMCKKHMSDPLTKPARKC